MKKFSIIAQVLWLALLPITLVFAQTSKEPLVIAHAAMSPPVLPLWIAVEKGFFQKEGLDITLVFVRGSPVLQAALHSGSIHAGVTGGTAALSATSGGLELQIVANTRSKLTYDIVAKPEIKGPSDIRGKIFGVQAIGGTVWMGALLGLEHLGLEPERDKVKIIPVGDQTVLAQALETGTIDLTVLDKPLSVPLKQKGFRILAELSRSSIPYAGVGLIFRRSFVEKRPEIIERTLRALIRAIAYLFQPSNKASVIDVMMRRFRLLNRTLAEDSYVDALQTIDRKPYPSLEGLRNIQRLMSRMNPAINKIRVEDVVDMRFMEELDKRGFIDEAYRTGGLSP